MRVVICDDDSLVRSLVGQLAEEQGHVVVGQTDQAHDVLGLIATTRPDIVIVDLSLRAGSGHDVIRMIGALATPCPVVVFTAFGREVKFEPPVCAVVDKPDFGRLVKVLADPAGLATPATCDRRAWESAVFRHARPVDAVSDPAPDFYEALADSVPGEALLVVRPDAAVNVPGLAPTVRQIVRTQDWLLMQSSRLVVLLVGGHPAAAASVIGRLRARGVDGDLLATTIAEGEAPADAFSRVIEQLV